MTVKEKQGFGLYFLLAFGLAWLLQVYASLLLLRDGNAAAYQLLLVVMFGIPAGCIVGTLKVLLDRIEEIGKGEEDAYRNY